MAEKYTEPLWRAGARFSATPGDGGLATANRHIPRPDHQGPPVPYWPLPPCRRRIAIAECPRAADICRNITNCN